MKICLSFKHLLVIYGVGALGFQSANAAKNLCARLLTQPATIEQMDVAITAYTKMTRELDLAKSKGDDNPMQKSLRTQEGIKKDELIRELRISESKFKELIRKKNKALNEEEQAKLKKEEEQRAIENEKLPPTGAFRLAKRIEKEFSRGHFLSRDKKQLVIFNDKGLTHIDLVSGTEKVIPIAETFRTLSLPLQDSIFISTRQGSFYTYEIQTQKLKKFKVKLRPETHPLNVYISLSPDQKNIMFQADGYYIYVEAKTNKVIESQQFPVRAESTFASNDHMVISSDTAVSLYTISTNKYVHLHDLDPNNFYHTSYSPKPLILDNGDFLLSIGNDLVRYDLQGNVVLEKTNRKHVHLLTAIEGNLWVRDDRHTGSVVRAIGISDLEGRYDLKEIEIGMLDDVIIKALSSEYVSIATFREYPIAKIFSNNQVEVPHFILDKSYQQAQERFRSQIISDDGKQILFFGDTANKTPFIDIWVPK